MNTERKPNYEEEAEYKYPILVLIVIVLGFLIKRIFS